MVALLAKTIEQAETDFAYLNRAMDEMIIDENASSPYALIPSRSQGLKHQVRFIDPERGVPYPTHCTCSDFRYRHMCDHCEIVETYFAMIYDLKYLPIYNAPVEENVTMHAPTMPQECLPGDQSVAEHVIDEEMERYHKDLLFEAAHGLSHLRMRAKDAGLTGLSRAGKDQLIGSLLAWRRHTLDRLMSPQLPEPAEKMSTNCPGKTWTRGEIVAVLRECLGILLSVCDGAIVPDGAGCNGADAKHLRWMQRKERWTTDDVLDVAEKLQKYNHTQLSARVPSMAVVRKVFGVSESVDYSQKGNLNGNQGFSLLRR
jgi:hypothetical protein